MKSIKLRLVIMYLVLVLIIMVSSGIFMFMGVRSRETDIVKKELKVYARFIEEQIIRNYDFDEYQRGFEELDGFLPNMRDIQGNIINVNGVTIASTASNNANISHSDSSIISALNGHPAYSLWKKSMDTDGSYKNFISYALPSNSMDGNTYVIFVQIETSHILNSLANYFYIIVFTTVFALILAAVIGFLFAKTLTDPIISLKNGATEIASGKFDIEIKVNTNDEIGKLTDSFNYMAKELMTSIAGMEAEKNKLEILLHNMTDGVLAYNNSGMLIHANMAAKDLLKFIDLDNLGFKDVMENLSIKLSTKVSSDISILKHYDLISETISIFDKYINMSFVPYFNQLKEVEGLVIVLHDITKHKKLDDMRKEFVANVSHEIRTPLTTIKTYAESLMLDGMLDDKKLSNDFLSTINSEIDRMTLLVSDLLDLSSFDNGQLKLDMKEINLIDVLNAVIKQNLILAENKNQHLILKTGKNTAIINADRARINQVFSNIITNSIKYSKRSSDIEVSLEETKKYYRVYIKDKGIGIPKEDIPHIFERFYRVDKARSRKMGGTGLGLSIAKEIMNVHGGQITASSEYEEGTTMILRFNKSIG